MSHSNLYLFIFQSLSTLVKKNLETLEKISGGSTKKGDIHSSYQQGYEL